MNTTQSSIPTFLQYEPGHFVNVNTIHSITVGWAPKHKEVEMTGGQKSLVLDGKKRTVKIEPSINKFCEVKEQYLEAFLKAFPIIADAYADLEKDLEKHAHAHAH